MWISYCPVRFPSPSRFDIDTMIFDDPYPNALIMMKEEEN